MSPRSNFIKLGHHKTFLADLLSKRFHILATAGFMLWLGCVGWSMTSAVGFVLSSRGEAIAERAAEAATRHTWEAPTS